MINDDLDDLIKECFHISFWSKKTRILFALTFPVSAIIWLALIVLIIALYIIGSALIRIIHSVQDFYLWIWTGKTRGERIDEKYNIPRN